MRAKWFAALAVVTALGGTWALVTSSGQAPPAVQHAFSSSGLAATDDDSLLMRARRELAEGGLHDDTRAALLASTDPAHARARRVLLAMDAPANPEPPAPSTVPDPKAAQLVVPTLATTASPPPKTPKPTPRPATRSESPAPRAPAPPAKVDARPTLHRVALSGSNKGATLTLDAGSGVVVGVANQRSSGIVRLLVEARAGASVLSSRPRVRGARVSAVRRIGRSVFVTLELDPGWSLKRIRKTGRGAKVELQAPA